MLKRSDLFHIPFYNKTHYTGSLNGMRYYIEKAEENDTAVFRVWIFPGPFCFAKTADDLKESKTFAFTEESLDLITDWINEQYEKRSDYWNKQKIITRQP